MDIYDINKVAKLIYAMAKAFMKSSQQIFIYNDLYRSLELSDGCVKLSSNYVSMDWKLWNLVGATGKTSLQWMEVEI